MSRLLGVGALAGIALVAAGGCKKSRASETAAAEGAVLFASLCARCHGAEGTGGLPVYDGGPSPRNFRDHAFQAARTDSDLRATIREGKSTGMPPFAAVLNDSQVDAVIAHLRSLDPERPR
jgi:cytochrome c oxidase cbb3-type subunit 3